MAVRDQPLHLNRLAITPQGLNTPTDFPVGAPYMLRRGQPTPRMAYPSASPHHVFIVTRWCWNIYQLSIAYASRPRLRSRLTLGGLAFPRKPWVYGGRVSHPSFATYAGILSSLPSTNSHELTSSNKECSSTTHQW